MRSIDNRVRDLAIRELERDGGASLAINISGLTATERSWFRGLVARLKERRDIATRLIVEITETAALQDIDETSRFVPALRALGCKVALDDFGSGFPHLHPPKALPAHGVKLDRPLAHAPTHDT